MVFIVIGLAALSCTEKKQNTISLPEIFEKAQIIPGESLLGKVYITASYLDTLKVKAKADSDCETSQILFLNDSVFVAVDYCLYVDTYYKGLYKIEGSEVAFRCEDLIVVKEFNEETEAESASSDLPLYFITTKTDKRIPFRWKGFYFKNKLCFKTSFGGYSTPEVMEEDFFKTAAKADSVWYKLGLE